MSGVVLRSRTLLRGRPFLCSFRSLSTLETATTPNPPPLPAANHVPAISSEPFAIAQPVTKPAGAAPMFIPPAEDPLLSLCANVIMKHGERHKAMRLITETLTYLHAITLSPPLPIFREAIQLASPMVKIVTIRKPSKNVLAPRPLNDRQRTKAAFRWIVAASEKKPGKMLVHRLAKEIIAVVKGDSDVLQKKEEVHRQAVANRANIPRR
ncbi:hypothetical protein FRB99_004054 [Tulasnella sp. 403]|nr:hypothetical protein FRB99_004054 [Tulasnella sp. 403]